MEPDGKIIVEEPERPSHVYRVTIEHRLAPQVKPVVINADSLVIGYKDYTSGMVSATAKGAPKTTPEQDLATLQQIGNATIVLVGELAKKIAATMNDAAPDGKLLVMPSSAEPSMN